MVLEGLPPASKVSKSVSGSRLLVKDLIWAVETLSKFIELRNSFSKIVSIFSNAGIDISSVNFSNPMSIIMSMMNAKNQGLDIDIDEVIEEMRKMEDFDLSEVTKAISILRKYISISRSIDASIRFLQKNTSSSIDINTIGSMYGNKLSGDIVGNSSKNDENYDDEDIDNSIDENEIRKIKEIVNEYKKKVD